mmetsp:Transcript_21703/g.88496  ORF Transcript_21703/g.88496 Transcript_21703/m.88496 type:complete len:128 (-) Transcript_21703:196-579(-)
MKLDKETFKTSGIQNALNFVQADSNSGTGAGQQDIRSSCPPRMSSHLRSFLDRPISTHRFTSHVDAVESFALENLAQAFRLKRLSSQKLSSQHLAGHLLYLLDCALFPSISTSLWTRCGKPQATSPR